MPDKARSRCSSSTSYDSLISPFSFHSQVHFKAFKDVLHSRSECFLESKRARDKLRTEEEIAKRPSWDITPPDFTLQNYQPKPAKRNSREAMIPGYDEDEWNRNARQKRRQRVQFEPVQLPKILQAPLLERAPFITQFRIPDSYAAKLIYVKDGMHKRGLYSAPGPHAFRGDDFRPLENPKKYGLPQFTASHEHDPGNIQFKSRTLDVLHESYKDKSLFCAEDGYRRQMITYQETQPKWEASLILPKGPYKKGRSPKSALMEHIARQLPWSADQGKRESLRPNIFDHKTVDWLAVTSINKKYGCTASQRNTCSSHLL